LLYKYGITQDPNYKYLSNAAPRNAFDIEKLLSTKLKPKPDKVFETFEVNVSDQST